jgi:hypothetical protein
MLGLSELDEKKFDGKCPVQKQQSIKRKDTGKSIFLQILEKKTKFELDSGKTIEKSAIIELYEKRRSLIKTNERLSVIKIDFQNLSLARLNDEDILINDSDESQEDSKIIHFMNESNQVDKESMNNILVKDFRSGKTFSFKNLKTCSYQTIDEEKDFTPTRSRAATTIATHVMKNKGTIKNDKNNDTIKSKKKSSRNQESVQKESNEMIYFNNLSQIKVDLDRSNKFSHFEITSINLEIEKRPSKLSFI